MLPYQSWIASCHAGSRAALCDQALPGKSSLPSLFRPADKVAFKLSCYLTQYPLDHHQPMLLWVLEALHYTQRLCIITSEGREGPIFWRNGATHLSLLSIDKIILVFAGRRGSNRLCALSSDWGLTDVRKARGYGRRDSYNVGL